MSKPIAGTYPSYFDNYIKHVDAESIADALAIYNNHMLQFFSDISADKATHSYAEGKWTLKEVLQHIIDVERVFAFRALSIARQDSTPLPGFDENDYAANSKANKRTWQNLLDEFEATRKSTNLLLLSFDEEQLASSGITNNAKNTVNAIAYTIIGHVLHHINVVKERYLVD